MSADQVFITGASGFIGSAVARKLIAAGFSVRALVRRRNNLPNLAGLDLELAEGNLRDRTSIRSAVAGARYVCHVAADYRLWALSRDDIFATNVVGTRILMEEAARALVERVVYTSSVATIPLRADGAPADETRSLRENEGIGAYKRSKIAAELMVRAMVADGLPVVIVNPSAPVGPRDVRPTPTGRIIIEAAAGRIPAFVDTGLNLVHVDDVADGHLAALQRGRAGERYILGGQNVSLSRMLEEIARLVNRRPPSIRLPWRVAMVIGHAAEFIASQTGREPFATVDGVEMARHRMFFSSAKAERDLGFRARPHEEGLEDAIRWFRNAGYLNARPSFWRRLGSERMIESRTKASM